MVELINGNNAEKVAITITRYDKEPLVFVTERKNIQFNSAMKAVLIKVKETEYIVPMDTIELISTEDK